MSDTRPWAGRMEAVRRALAAHGLGGAVIWARSAFDRPGPVAHLTGYLPAFPSSADAPGIVGLGQCALVLPVADAAVLVIDAIARLPEQGAVPAVRAADIASEIAGRLRALGADRVPWALGGEDIVPYRAMRLLGAALPAVRFVPFDDVLAELRRPKSRADVQGMRRAADVARLGFEAAIDAIGVGVSERRVAAAGTAACLAGGADFVRYVRVSAAPPKAGSGWPPATDAPIWDGDVVTMDLIGAVDGYAFDLLRTAVVGSARDDALALVHDAYRICQEARRALVPGGTVAGLVEAVRAAAAATASAPYLGGFFGHGIGLETLERPYLVPGQEAVFVEGEVLCIEPGLFRPGIGSACLEDEVAVRAGADGPELLSGFLQAPLRVG